MNLSNRRMLEKSVLLRARMILLAFEKRTNTEISQQLGIERHCVGRWRSRWKDSVEALLAIELNEPHAALRRAIIDVLRDAHRSGRRPKFSAEQIARIILLGSQKPKDFERPVQSWTGRELADEAQKQEIVTSISVSRVNEFLRLVNLEPQHRKGWCFTTEKDEELFHAQVQEVCQKRIFERSSVGNRKTPTQSASTR